MVPEKVPSFCRLPFMVTPSAAVKLIVPPLFMVISPNVFVPVVLDIVNVPFTVVALFTVRVKAPTVNMPELTVSVPPKVVVP